MTQHQRYGSQAVMGALLILAGALLLLENQGLLDIGPIWRFWPVIVVGFGAVKLFRAESRSEQGSGIWIMLIGLWLLVSVLHLWDLGFRDTWPAVFIAFGASILWKNLPPMRSPEFSEGNHHG